MVLWCPMSLCCLLFSSRIRHTRCALVTGVQTCALPISDVPGIREVIEDGRTGLLCAPTAAALRDAIERLLSDEPLRRRLGGNARQQIEMTASLDRVAELELSAYRATLSEPLKEPHLGS